MSAITEQVAGRTLSFEDLFRREYPSVYRATYLATGSVEAAQDITQEAFARAYARWRRLKSQPWVGGWVMTTALNLCKKHRIPASPADHSFENATNGKSDLRVDLIAQLRLLPLRQRTAVVLFYLGDLPVPHIAQLMHVSEGTVKAHLAQARSALRKSLEEADD